jgi:hypothetical protein
LFASYFSGAKVYSWKSTQKRIQKEVKKEGVAGGTLVPLLGKVRKNAYKRRVFKGTMGSLNAIKLIGFFRILSKLSNSKP